MGTQNDHRRYAEECVAMARRCEEDSDKALWLTLAQSWVRLAEHAEHALSEPDFDAESEHLPDVA
jgi:hypothetical protein